MTDSSFARSALSWARADWPGLAIAAALLATSAIGYAPVVGFAWDDGVYIAAGRALADGLGYILPGRAGDFTVPTFPAGYPLLVAVIWKVGGSLMPTLAIASVLGGLSVAAACYLWWRLVRDEYGPAAAWLVAVPALSYASWSVAALRTADAPYALLVACAGTIQPRAPSSSIRLAALVAIAAAAVALRTAGAVLAVAVFLMLLHHRRYRWAVALAALAALSQILLVSALRTPQPSYVELIRAAWSEGGAGRGILKAGLTRGMWEAFGSFLVPPVLYSGAVRRLTQGSTALATAYVAGLLVLGTAVLWGGWQRLVSRRWQVGDLALTGALALPFVTPLGMDPRFLVPYAAVVATWLLESLRGVGQWLARQPAWGTVAARVAAPAGALLLALLACSTFWQTTRAARALRSISPVRLESYAQAADAARRWLDGRGLLVAEFPETLWLHGGHRVITTTSPLENVLQAHAGDHEVSRRVTAVGRGCLLDTQVFPTSRRAFEAVAARPGSVRLAGVDQRFVRVACWGRGDTPALAPTRTPT